MSPPSVAQVVEQIRAALQARDYRAFAACFAEDGAYELPFALPGRPARYQGADAIRGYIEAGMQQANQLFEMRGVETRLQACQEADTAFVEFFLSGQSPSAAPFRLASSAALISCRDGKVVLYRDFPNSLGIAQAAGRLPQFLAALSPPPASR